MPEKKHISFSLVCVQTIKLEQSEFLTFAGKHSAGTLLFFFFFFLHMVVQPKKILNMLLFIDSAKLNPNSAHAILISAKTTMQKNKELLQARSLATWGGCVSGGQVTVQQAEDLSPSLSSPHFEV